MVHGLQRYVVHVLTTAYRHGNILLSKEQSQPVIDILTPILEKSDLEYPQSSLPISYVWLLSCTLPQCYLQVRYKEKKTGINNIYIIYLYLYKLCIYLCVYVCLDQRFTEGHNSLFDSQNNRQYLSKALDIIV